jgi:hypothetical protein
MDGLDNSDSNYSGNDYSESEYDEEEYDDLEDELDSWDDDWE